MNCYIQNGDNPDITFERKNATFPVEQLELFYYGGKKTVQNRKDVEKYLEDHPSLQDPFPSAFMSRDELVDNSARKMAEMFKHNKMVDMSNIERTTYFLMMVHVRDTMAFSLHYVMFLPVIQSQASDEQFAKWMPMALSGKVTGTYAQTELGHGTNLAKLETTATYDSKTSEFVLNSPTISSAKWWPGSLGKWCNHAIVVAMLHINGENKGPHPFMVQLRDLDTHHVLPNLKLGDIGPKYGTNSSDNGYLMFTNFRIPRENMMMRHSQVSPDGNYIKPSHSKLAYGGMVYVRSMMVCDIANHLAVATTIATRYSCVRRQGEITPGSGEVQIIDYRTQQYRIFPYIARSIAFRLAGQELRDQFMIVSKQVKQGNVALLPEMHALSSGLKAVVTFEVQKGIEQCRLSCGGHGYSHASGFPELIGYSCGSCTYEGDNIVLLLQVAKFLVKAVEQIKNGKGSELADICGYLGKRALLYSSLVNHSTYSDEDIIADFEHVARNTIFRAVEKYKMALLALPHEEAWNSVSIELCKAARTHVRLFIVKTFLKRISKCTFEISEVLRNLAKLYVFDIQSGNTGLLMEGGYMNTKQIDEVKCGLNNCMSILRPNAVSVVDSFGIHEIELKSVLGRRDGNVYPAMLEWAQNSSLNRTDVLPAYKKYMEPIKTHSKM